MLLQHILFWLWVGWFVNKYNHETLKCSKIDNVNFILVWCNFICLCCVIQPCILVLRVVCFDGYCSLLVWYFLFEQNLLQFDGKCYGLVWCILVWCGVSTLMKCVIVLQYKGLCRCAFHEMLSGRCRFVCLEYYGFLVEKIKDLFLIKYTLGFQQKNCNFVQFGQIKGDIIVQSCVELCALIRCRQSKKNDFPME